MPFKKNDPNTRAAAKKGGNTGVKHFTSAPKHKLKLISKKGGKASVAALRAARRAREQAKLDKAAKKYEDKVMSGYIKT